MGGWLTRLRSSDGSPVIRMPVSPSRHRPKSVMIASPMGTTSSGLHGSLCLSCQIVYAIVLGSSAPFKSNLRSLTHRHLFVTVVSMHDHRNGSHVRPSNLCVHGHSTFATSQNALAQQEQVHCSPPLSHSFSHPLLLSWQFWIISWYTCILA